MLGDVAADGETEDVDEGDGVGERGQKSTEEDGEVGGKASDGELDFARAMADTGVVVSDDLEAVLNEGVDEEGIPLDESVRQRFDVSICA